jgi:ABC-type iron transport system FetAB ATPase subunit
MESRIPQSFVHHVVPEVMGKREVAAWWVSHTSDQRTMQKEITTQLLACYQKEKKRVFKTQCCTDET